MAFLLASLGKGRGKGEGKPQAQWSLETLCSTSRNPVDPELSNSRILYAAELPVAGTPSAPGYGWDDSLLAASFRVGG